MWFCKNENILIYLQNNLLRIRIINVHKNKIHFCFAGNFCLFFVGSEKINFSNGYGFQVDLTWLTIVSAAFSLFSILYSINWTMEPIEKQTNKLIGMISFIPLFLFRMISWLLICLLYTSPSPRD